MDSASKKHLYIYIYIKTICEEKSTVWKNLEYTFQKLKNHLKILVNKTLLLKVFQIETLPLKVHLVVFLLEVFLIKVFLDESSIKCFFKKKKTLYVIFQIFKNIS